MDEWINEWKKENSRMPGEHEWGALGLTGKGC